MDAAIPHKPMTSGYTLDQMARLVANLYRQYPDDHVITIGDWLPHPIKGQPDVFHATVRFTVGDFRRWAQIMFEAKTNTLPRTVTATLIEGMDYRDK